MAADYPKRIAVAAVGIPAAFGLVYLGGWPLTALIAFLGAVGASEFVRLVRAGGGRPSLLLAAAGAVAAPAVVLLLVEYALDSRIAAGLLVAWVLLVLAWAVFFLPPARDTIGTVAATVMAPLYASALPSAILWLRHGVTGLDALGATWIVFFPLAMTWVCDSFAMTGGSLLGGPKLAPTVSPNKTWSGAISGLMGAVLVAVVFSFLVFSRYEVPLALGWAVGLGVAVGFLGQVGDLAESLFKRSVGVKDSGRFFPGHGGVLDRLDSLYWVLPVTALGLAAAGVL